MSSYDYDLSYYRKNPGTLAVRNEAQKVLFEDELSGQISDGQWENATPHHHWIPWSFAKVIVDPDNVGRTFDPVKDNYRLDDPGLLDVVGGRMIRSVVDKTKNPWYDFAELKADLKDLKTIFKTKRV